MNIDNLIGVHSEALKTRAQRTKLLATNIANSDTPNYKARDIVFADTLKEAGWHSSTMPGASQPSRLKATMNTTHQNHMQLNTSNLDAPVMYRQPFHASLDGNTVDKDAEQARFAENAIRYQASLEFIGSRISSVIRTLRGE